MPPRIGTREQKPRSRNCPQVAVHSEQAPTSQLATSPARRVTRIRALTASQQPRKQQTPQILHPGKANHRFAHQTGPLSPQPTRTCQQPTLRMTSATEKDLHLGDVQSEERTGRATSSGAAKSCKDGWEERGLMPSRRLGKRETLTLNLESWCQNLTVALPVWYIQHRGLGGAAEEKARETLTCQKLLVSEKKAMSNSAVVLPRPVNDASPIAH
ncbi:hypothetical protein CONLIGDRAFT_79928 [Coniochaeta ligniaria NRRL 30616]|uniref:Uncharacterized protein n=1 Tax=Coniochaeta ligniaria NRRL 30616 TaxID=1408157 RepID=A0A1J7JBU4_9PEZI|nr:hypothetical protein CONLIGDRAFT_79928 [Coniochaeta ligniaria NRRL 30616]